MLGAVVFLELRIHTIELVGFYFERFGKLVHCHALDVLALVFNQLILLLLLVQMQGFVCSIVDLIQLVLQTFCLMFDLFLGLLERDLFLTTSAHYLRVERTIELAL